MNKNEILYHYKKIEVLYDEDLSTVTKALDGELHLDYIKLLKRELELLKKLKTDLQKNV